MSSESLKGLISKNKDILKNTFLTLIAQLFITFLVIYTVRFYPKVSEMLQNIFIILGLFFISIGLIFFISNTQLSTNTRMIFFTIFSIIFGLMLSYLNKINPTILVTAAAGTVSIFATMFMIGLVMITYGVDLSLLGLVLFMALLTLIIAELLSFCFNVSNRTKKFYLYAGLFIFSLYIMYDTYFLIEKHPDFINGAMGFYLDILNIFVRIVRLLKE